VEDALIEGRSGLSSLPYLILLCQLLEGCVIAQLVEYIIDSINVDH